jgi:hypothetical protein
MVRRQSPWPHGQNLTDSAPNGTSSAQHGTSSRCEPRQRAWQHFVQRLPQVRAELTCLAAVQADRLRWLAARTVTRLLTGTFLVLTAVAMTTVAASMVLSGVAGGLERWLVDTPWLASLLTGSAALCTMFTALLLAARWHRNGRLEQLRSRYERLRAVAPHAATPTATATTAGRHGR